MPCLSIRLPRRHWQACSHETEACSPHLVKSSTTALQAIRAAHACQPTQHSTDASTWLPKQACKATVIGMLHYQNRHGTLSYQLTAGTAHSAPPCKPAHHDNLHGDRVAHAQTQLTRAYMTGRLPQTVTLHRPTWCARTSHLAGRIPAPSENSCRQKQTCKTDIGGPALHKRLGLVDTPTCLLVLARSTGRYHTRSGALSCTRQ